MDSFLIILGLALYIVFFVAKKKKQDATPTAQRPIAEPEEYPAQQAGGMAYTFVAEEKPQPAPPPRKKAEEAPHARPKPTLTKGEATETSLKKDLRKAIIYSEIINRKY